jgi:hypothetical protein
VPKPQPDFEPVPAPYKKTKRKLPKYEHGSREFLCTRITKPAVDALLRGRRALLPLADAAELAGLDPIAAQAWLVDGRALAAHAKHRRGDSVAPWRKLTRHLAIEWDRAASEYVVKLRELLLEHAQKDPKVALQLLASVERDYARTRAHRADRTLLADYVHKAAERNEPVPDLHERFSALDVPAQYDARTRQVSVTKQLPDGSSTTATVTETAIPEVPFERDMDERSNEDLDFYADHGCWPEEAPRAQQAIDAEGVAVLEPDAATVAELAKQLGDAEEEEDDAHAALEAAETAQALGNGATMRLPDPVLPQIENGERVVTVPRMEAPEKPARPAYPPLRRIDPLAQDG